MSLAVAPRQHGSTPCCRPSGRPPYRGDTMATAAARTFTADRSATRPDRHDARYQAFVLLRIAFVVAPIAFDLDKFFNVLVDWPIYLAPWINDIAPGSGQDFMYFVGAVEIVAGISVAIKP